MSCVTVHVPVEMNQLHSGQIFSSSLNIESSKLCVLCAKTHRRGILLLSSICKVNRNLFLMLIKHVCYSNKKTIVVIPFREEDYQKSNQPNEAVKTLCQ